jgi:hypothetical protein
MSADPTPEQNALDNMGSVSNTETRKPTREERVCDICGRAVEEGRDRPWQCRTCGPLDEDETHVESVPEESTEGSGAEEREPCYCTDDYPATPGCEDCQGSGSLPAKTRIDRKPSEGSVVHHRRGAMSATIRTTNGPEGPPSLTGLVGKLAPSSFEEPACGLCGAQHPARASTASDALLRARPRFLGADLAAALTALQLRVHLRFPLSVGLSEHTHSIAGVKRECSTEEEKAEDPEPCYRSGDGRSHDEALRCAACERPVCGYCAEPVGNEWLCPACPADPKNPAAPEDRERDAETAHERWEEVWQRVDWTELREGDEIRLRVLDRIEGWQQEKRRVLTVDSDAGAMKLTGPEGEYSVDIGDSADAKHRRLERKVRRDQEQPPVGTVTVPEEAKERVLELRHQGEAKKLKGERRERGMTEIRGELEAAAPLITAPLTQELEEVRREREEWRAALLTLDPAEQPSEDGLREKVVEEFWTELEAAGWSDGADIPTADIAAALDRINERAALEAPSEDQTGRGVSGSETEREARMRAVFADLLDNRLDWRDEEGVALYSTRSDPGWFLNALVAAAFGDTHPETGGEQ